MYAIIPKNDIIHTDYKVEIEHSKEKNQIAINCKFDTDKKALFELIAEGAKSIFYKKIHKGGDKLEINLNGSANDCYTLQIKNEAGLEVDSYMIMKSFC